MNVNDVEAKTPEGDMLVSIFQHQRELHEKYKPIEERNGIGFGLVKERVFDINDRYWQAVLKDFSYRVTEELTESAEAYEMYLCNRALKDHKVHAVEELIDALHFITEYCILVGIAPESIPETASEVETDLLCHIYCGFQEPRLSEADERSHAFYYFEVIKYLGIASNLLKLRPWKNTHLVTDTERYSFWMCKSYRSLIRLIYLMGVDAPDLYAMYTKKNSVNQWRINSGY